MNVGVIGSGSIGPDLAYGFASALSQSGTGKVFLHDIRKDALDAGVARINGYIQKGRSRGRLNPRVADAIVQALVPTLELTDLKACDYVLEAATEDLATKQAILRKLESVVKDDCLIGFATSGIPRARIAEGAVRQERCFVNHPFYPAWRALPIEVVLSGHAALGARMIDLLVALGKVPIVTSDVPCFAADDIFCNYISEAARIVEEGIATPAQVDRIVNDRIGGGGPFNVMDLTRGNTLTVHCQELMREAPTGSDWFAAPEILTRQGPASWLDPVRPADGSYRPEQAAQVMDRILAVLLARTYFVVDQEICDPSDLNWLTRNALGFNDGLLDLAEQVGGERAHALCHEYGSTRPGFTIPPSLERKALRAFYRDVKVRSEGDIAVITIRRPEVKNALTARTMQELGAVVTESIQAPSVKGMVVTGFGGALAGADINELAALRTPADCEAMCLRGHAILDIIAKSPKPIVAAVDGPVLGGGAELSMACHGRVVGPHLVVGQPEVNLGIIPGYGGTQRLPRLIAVERALEMLRTGRTMSSDEAWQSGWATASSASNLVQAACDLVSASLAGKVALAPADPKPVPLPADLPKVDIGHRSRVIDSILVDVVRRGLAVPLDEGLRDRGGGIRTVQDHGGHGHRDEELHPERSTRSGGISARIGGVPIMASETSIVILDGGRRLPRADILINNRKPGLLSRFSTTQLGGMAIKAALKHTPVDPALIGHVVMGMAQHSHRDSIYAAQGMRWRGGLGHDVPALTVARICGSGAEALAVASEMMIAGLRHDEARPFSVVGGAESMQYPFVLYNMRGRAVGETVQKYGPIDAKTLPGGTHLQDMLLMSLYDPSARMSMANTAEELGRRYRISRDEADAFGFLSHVSAKVARDNGWFKEETEPVSIDGDGTGASLAVDTHIMDDISREGMAALRPAFEAGGVITAGNASAVVDGAAAMVIGKESDAAARGLKPIARVAGIGVAGCDPSIMGYGPVPATRNALAKAGIKGADIDHVELNEAFAPQALACVRDFEKMGIDPAKVNPQGGAIALGHPLGATGAILTLTCAYALRRAKRRFGLVTMCIGGGQGIAVVLEAA